MSTSTSGPSSMNAVRSATRAACCMLWVTITIVTRDFSSSIGPFDPHRHDA
jgi:hypothetical protein